MTLWDMTPRECVYVLFSAVSLLLAGYLLVVMVLSLDAAAPLYYSGGR